MNKPVLIIGHPTSSARLSRLATMLALSVHGLGVEWGRIPEFQDGITLANDWAILAVKAEAQAKRDRKAARKAAQKIKSVTGQKNIATKFYDGKPGQYLCLCSVCYHHFYGAKRDVVCPACTP